MLWRIINEENKRYYGSYHNSFDLFNTIIFNGKVGGINENNIKWYD